MAKRRNTNPPDADDIREMLAGEEASGILIEVSPNEIDLDDQDGEDEVSLRVVFNKSAFAARYGTAEARDGDVFGFVELLDDDGNLQRFDSIQGFIDTPSQNFLTPVLFNDPRTYPPHITNTGRIPEIFYFKCTNKRLGIFEYTFTGDTLQHFADIQKLLDGNERLTFQFTLGFEALDIRSVPGVSNRIPNPGSNVDIIVGRRIQFLSNEFGGELLGAREVQILPVLPELKAPPSPAAVISLRRAGQEVTPEQVLYPLIRNRTLDFNNYKTFMDEVMCKNPRNGFVKQNSLPFPGVESYALLKAATEAYMMQECGFVPQESIDGDVYNDPLSTSRRSIDFKSESKRLGYLADEKRLRILRNNYLDLLESEVGNVKVLPYYNTIRQKLSDLPLKNYREAGNCYGILRSRIESPCMVELIWSYWHEQGMLVQTMNALMLRFQNVRYQGADRDPLYRLDLDPLRNLSNILWGMVQDEQHTLSISRRAYEYDHEYGLTLIGKAVPQIKPVDSRSNFLESFHNLLTSCSVFFKDADDTTRIADGFPILNNLREVHMLLAEGFHNAYGSLTWTARQEMMIQQWVLARPEFREFIGGRIMVPYREPWMDRVDMVKQMEGWGTTSITHFHDLATFGEQILLSIRFGDWSKIEDRDAASNWAIYWRNEIQRYIHAYRTVSAVDLSADAVDTTTTQRALQPAILLQRRTQLQVAQAAEKQKRA